MLTVRSVTVRILSIVLVFILILSLIPVISYDVSAQTSEENVVEPVGRGAKASQYSFTFQLSDGWSLITMPLYNDSYSTAEQLVDAIPCNYVRGWNMSSQNWEMHERNKTENDFQLENGTGYFVYLEDNKDFMIEGKGLPGVEINLKKGWSPVGWYEKNATYPEKIMSDIINSTSVAYWNTTLSRFVVHGKGMDISNFSIPEGTGLFVYTETDSIWDTLPTIFSVEHDATGVLSPSDKFNVTLKGDENYNAVFDIDSAVSGIAMTEESPGVYKGSHTITTGDPSGTYSITGHLSSERYTDNKDASTTVTIDTTPPAAITGLTAADAETGGVVNLAWNTNTNSDFAHYNIYQNTSTITDVTGMTPINNSITNNATTTYQVTGLTDGTTYYFAVTAVDNSGNENKTVNDASAIPTTVPTISSVTHDATGSLKTGSVLTVTLNGDQGLTATFDVGTAAKWVSMTEGTGANKGKYTGSYTVQNGDDGTWTVTGYLNSTGTASMDATPNVVIDTIAPEISSVQSSSVNDTSATITWTTDENSDSLVEYGTTISYGSTKSDATMVTSHSIQLTGLTASTLYHYRVKSTDTADNTATSSDYNFTTAAEPDTTPPTFAGLTSATDAGTGGTIDLSWNAASDPSTPITYNIYQATTSGGQNFAAPSYTTTSLSYQVTGLIDGTTYYFVVRAEDSAGNEDTNIVEKSATPTAPDTTLPNVTSTTPADAVTGVAVTTTIIVQFSEEMNQANTEGAFSTNPATTGTFSWNPAGDKMTYTPSASLDYSTSYEVSITNSATDLAGNPLDGDGDGVQDNPASKDTYKFSFTTEAEADTTGPTVSSVAVNPTTVIAGETSTLTANVDDSTTGNSNIASAEWSKGASAASPGSGTAMSASDGAFDSPTEGVTASIDTTGWSAGIYTIWVRGKDSSNNWGDAVSTTLTVTGADTTLPTVTSTTPTDAATGVAVTTTIVVQFSEEMDKTNTQGAFSTNPSTTGSFSWNGAGDTMTYTPSASLVESTTYTVTITISATDLAGNQLDGDGDGVAEAANKDNYVFSFTTAGGGGGTVNKYAVIVGISDYKAISDLSYCDEDATDWYNYLKTQGYTSWVYGDGHTQNYPKHDGYATEYNVKAAINNMISLADSNDIIAYIDSGHGTKSGANCLCCMWDYGAGENGEDGALLNSELKALFDGVSVGGIFIFLDTCNSGGMNGVMSNANANIVYMATTCTSGGYGYDDPGSENGLWTEYFLNKGLVSGQSGHTDMEGNFAWAHANYPKSGLDEPQEFDGDTAKLFYLKPP